MKKQGSYSTLLNLRVLKGLLSLSAKGYFVQRGWLKSYELRQALAPDGQPIPWLTYSFLDFLEGRLHKGLTLYEYGAGNSTLFFAKQVASVRSIEHNEEWYRIIQNNLPDNVNIHYIPLGDGAYQNAISSEEQSFDVVLVDGRERVACIKNAVNKLKENGVIILDDAEREKYKEAFTFMKSKGFRYLPFSGIAIGAIHDKSTVVFYKDQNCLGI